MLLRRGDADAMLCGTTGRHATIQSRSEPDRPGTAPTFYAAMNILLLPQRILFLCDTYINTRNPR